MADRYSNYPWTKTARMAPFDEDGSLQSYAHGNNIDEPRCVLAPFAEELTIVDFDKGWRSAHRVIWQARDGRTFPMFISEFLKIVKMYQDKPLATFPKLDGLWKVVKQGANYGISLVSEN